MAGPNSIVAEYINSAGGTAVSGGSGAFQGEISGSGLLIAAQKTVAAALVLPEPSTGAAVRAVLDAFHNAVPPGDPAAGVIIAVGDQ